MPPVSEDQGNDLSAMTILMPGDEPQATQDNAVAPAAASPAAEEDAFKEAYEAAGVKPPETKAPAPATTPLDPALIEALSKLDPTQLPPELQEKYDKNYHAAFTKKTQTLAEERRAFEQQRNDWFARTEKILERLGTPSEQPKDRDKLADLRERIRSGDVEAIDAYVDEVSNAKVAPIQREMALKNAYEVAVANEPLVQQYAEDIGAVLRQRPDLREVVNVADHKFAPLVFIAVAKDIALAKAQEYIAGEAERFSKGLNAYKAKVMSLPSTTSQAGTTHTSPGETRKPAATMEEARAGLMRELKGLGVV